MYRHTENLQPEIAPVRSTQPKPVLGILVSLKPENEKCGRIGLELGYTGRQALTDDPYRSVSAPYFELNAFGEIRLRGVSVFFNAINLTNVRQTRFDPLIRPTPEPGGNPITDV